MDRREPIQLPGRSKRQPGSESAGETGDSTIEPASLRQTRDRIFSQLEEQARKLRQEHTAEARRRRIRSRMKALQPKEPDIPVISSALIDVERSRRLSREIQRRLGVGNVSGSPEESLAANPVQPVDLAEQIRQRKKKAEEKEIVRITLMTPPDES